LIDGIVDFHYCRLIAAPVAIVRRGEHRHDAPIVLPLVPFHDQLVRPRDEVEAVDVSELFGNILTERVPGSPR